MDLAIVLGQSEYNENLELPACKNDLFVIKKVLDATKKYQEILFLDDSCKSRDDIQNSITAFIEKYKNESISECFFYFTGHGKVDELGFYYLCNDYEEMNYPQGMIPNKEIDDIIRKLSPKVYVKVIDACHSGIEYIKSVDEPNYNIDANKHEFESCYFLFSCKKEQNSYIPQNEKFSTFTKAFITALKNEKGNNIRYTNIISYLANAFKDDKRQKPIFITQGTFSDIFYNKNSEIDAILPSIFELPDLLPITDNNIKSSLLDLIKQDSKRYLKFSEVEQIFNEMKKHLEDFKFENELSDIFDKEIEEVKAYEEIPNISSIAEWVNDINEDLFVDVHKKRVEYQAPATNSLYGISYEALLSTFSYIPKKDEKTITRVRYDPDYISSKLNLPYCGIYITLNSKFPNILNSSYCFVPVLSRTNIFLFSTKIDFERKNWDEQIRKTYGYKWNCKEFDFKIETINTYISATLTNDFYEAIKQELSSIFLTKK